MGDLDEFRLVRVLGRGGMGEVYLGHDTILDRPVAIKLIGAHDPDAASRERFLTEARAIARLSHPNVVAIYRVGTTEDGRPYLVQELIYGCSLDRLTRPVPWRRLCELAVGVARGLETAHRRGILHRDVKPANVMVDEAGTPRLLDFGLAKVTAIAPLSTELVVESPRAAEAVAETVGGPSQDRDVAVPVERPLQPITAMSTRPGALLGTPRYCAPELWRGETATVRSDLYSFGVMLYELAADVAPYPQRELDELEVAVLAGGARPVAELAPELPARMARIIDRCLALDPRDRPDSTAEVLHELEAGLVDAPAIGDETPYRGLRAFDAEHRAVFFGRGPDISALIDRLRTDSLIAVTGDSGIGKSSVCHAGVVPAVIAGALDDQRRWRGVAIVPGRRPWDTLLDALGVARDHPVEDIARAILPASDTGVVVMIDQLEELVTIAEPEQARLVASLLAQIADGLPGIKALVAVRGDFLTRVAASGELGDRLTRGLHLLRVLSPGDLREAVIGPARAHGVAFETDAMVEQLVGAVAGNLGALPLLQFTLAELWNARDLDRDVITQRALDELGGVQGALARRADAVILQLAADQRTIARRILLGLVTTEHTRAIRTRDELVVGDDAGAVLEALVHGRLVVARDTIDGVASYQLAHESLIRSWHTLRDWLDAAVGEHAARNRLVASAAEWERLDFTPELLWTRHQLDEVARLDALAQREQRFVDASRVQLTRRRLLRAAAVLVVPVIALAVYGAMKVQAARRRSDEIATHLAAEARARTTADALAHDAAMARARAFAAFDGDRTDDGEQAWAAARSLTLRADAAYQEATRELEGAFLVDADAVRAPMASLLWAHAELVETLYEPARLDTLLGRLGTYDPALRASWDEPAHVTFTVDAATIEIYASAPPAQLIATLTGTHREATVAAGSYLAVATTADHRVVRAPFVVGRGERRTESFVVPAQPRAGFVYIPAGTFLYGSARDDAFRREFLRTPPLHAVASPAFWIAENELTFGEWLAYLRTLSPEERARRRPAIEGTLRALRLDDDDGHYVLSIIPAKEKFRAAEGEPLHYPGRDVRWERTPVVGITVDDVEAYAAWLDHTGAVPGARLCTVREWERAARGADGRSYPHGETLEPTDANFDRTYNRTAFRMDEVGSFPRSDSPFGIHDLAGNVSEMVRGGAGFLIKGGSYYLSSVTALASNSSPMDHTLKTVQLGARLCADPAR